MDKLSMCRICLVKYVKMYSLISANLQELYERLTSTPFETKDKRPIQVCYLCCARLQNCYRLQVVCLKSEEFFNKFIADSEFNEFNSMLQDLNTLKTVHPLLIMGCVPLTVKDIEDNKIDEDNDFKFDPLEIASDVQVKHELFEDHSYTDEEVHIKSEVTVEEEDICAKYGDISDNRHTIQNTELEHDIHLKTVKIVLERIDLEAFKLGGNAAKNSKKPGLPNGNTDSTISIKPQTGLTVVQANNIEKKIQTREKNKNIVEQKSFIEKRIKKEYIELSSNADSSVKVYKCVVCEKSFSDKSELLRHTRTHTGNKRPYKCKVCEQIFITKNHLQIHIHRIHTGKQPYACKICEKSYARKSELTEHTQTHTDKKPYKCNICGKRYNRKDILATHTLVHTGERPYRCNICEYGFTRKSSLINHSRLHTGEKPYVCKVCEKSFTKIGTLINHRRIHTGEKPYKCNVCGLTFRQKNTLINHKRRHNGEKPYRCNVCGQCFVTSGELLSHNRSIHGGEKPYSCEICEKRFSQKFILVRHTRIHTGERPYRCHLCEKSFISKAGLVNHTFTHSAERPLYKCDICQKSFTTKRYLVSHIRKHMKNH